MNQQQDPESQLYEHVVLLFRGHARMLEDARRNAAFFEALRRVVTPESRVVDIGTGTGLWAIAAAKLGAKKVIAIERDPLLLGLIQGLAADNGVAGSVEVVIGDSRQIALPREADIVLSETIGNLGFDEDIVPIMADARERFLKPGGILIPGSLTLKAAPARSSGGADGLLQGAALHYELFESLNRHIPMAVTNPAQLELLAPAADLVRVDLSSAEATLAFGELRACWTLADLRGVDGIAVWAESMLVEGVALSNAETSSWSPVLYRIKPLTKRSGALEFKLVLTSNTNIWTVKAPGAQGEETQSYSPSFVAAKLLAQSRLPHAASGAPPVIGPGMHQNHA